MTTMYVIKTEKSMYACAILLSLCPPEEEQLRRELNALNAVMSFCLTEDTTENNLVDLCSPKWFVTAQCTTRQSIPSNGAFQLVCNYGW